MAWYSSQKRDLPWRATTDPYAVWLSEVMLQQTRVDTVIPYYERFLTAFPTVFELAEAPIDHVLTLWAGLGYYRRARMLHAAAREIGKRGAFPKTAAELLTVAGIGPYTAGAVASIAFQERAPLVDGNVHRVLSRIFAIDLPAPEARKVCWDIAADIVPASRPGDFNQALMELGAVICTPSSPRCERCPVAKSCAALASGKVAVLPRPPQKKPPKAEKRSALLLRRGTKATDEVLFARRLSSLRFGGLWEPPMMLGSFGPKELRALGLAPKTAGASAKPTHVGSLRHVLTHRILEVDVYRLDVKDAAVAHAANLPKDVTEAFPEYDTFAWAKPADAPGGVSTLARKVLAWL